MAKPTILAVDDDPVVSKAITRDLRDRFGADFRVVGATSGPGALELLTEFTLRGRAVALVVSDQRMPGMSGIELLERVRGISPDTKLLLLTAYADTDVAIRAINEIGLDYYLLKPWDPPQDKLYPVVEDLLGDWQRRSPRRPPTRCAWSATAGPTAARRSRPSWPATTCPTPGSTSSGTTAPQSWSSWPAPSRRTCPSCWCPTVSRCAARPTARWPPPWGCTPSPTRRSTTSASSAGDRPVSPPPSTPRPRDCAPSWSSATHRAGRPGRAPRSRTTSAFPRGCPAPTSPTVRWPRSPGSGRRWSSPARPSGCASRARCARSSSTAPTSWRHGPW